MKKRVMVIWIAVSYFVAAVLLAIVSFMGKEGKSLPPRPVYKKEFVTFAQGSFLPWQQLRRNADYRLVYASPDTVVFSTMTEE